MGRVWGSRRVVTVPWARPLKGGPDAHRYIALANGGTVSRPFHLRWLLPKLCGESGAAWWFVWLAAWPTLAAGMLGWRLAAGDDYRVAVAATVLVVALPGILGPPATIPVGVDLPATALTICAAGLFELGDGYRIAAGLILLGWASAIRETSPVWCALWVWSPWPLLALVVPTVRHLCVKPGADPLGPRFDEIARHPISAAVTAHQGRWRDGWLMVAPWGVCLAALYAPDWRLAAVLAFAYAQLLVATDTVRLLHHAAGPVMAAAAARNIPAAWLPVACVAGVFWFWKTERV